MNEGEFATRLGLRGVPAAAETIILERDMRLVELTGAPLSRRPDLLPAPRSTSSAPPRRSGCRSPAASPSIT